MVRTGLLGPPLRRRGRHDPQCEAAVSVCRLATACPWCFRIPVRPDAGFSPVRRRCRQFAVLSQSSLEAESSRRALSAPQSLEGLLDRLLAAIVHAEAAVAAAAAAVQAAAARLELLHEEREMNDLIAFNGGTWTVD